MTIPTVTRYDDFRIALWNLGDGSKTVLNPESLLDLQFETVPGVGGDRLKSATFQMPWYAQARAAFDFDALQLVEIDRYADPTKTLWGIVLKPKESYSGRAQRDTLQVQVVQIEELLKSRKVHYSEEDGGGPIMAVNAYPDDFAKLLVTKVFSGTDVDGNSRAWGWGTLAVAADASECAETASFALLSGDEEDDNLYKHVDGMARAYDFDYQLKVSVTGGAFTFTFETQAPYGGDDLTTGANRVMVKDLYNLVPSATRYRDAAMRATAMYVRGYSDILLDAAAITKWGRWEGVAAGTLLSDAEVALEKARVHEGAEYGFEATGANGMVRWLEHFKAGDKCLRINNRLGIAGDSEKIAAVIGRFQNKVLQLTIRWGDREPGLTDRQSGGGYAPGGGDGTVPIVAKPVQTDGSTGVDPHAHVYGDHEHALRLTADDTNYAAIDANGVLNVVGANGIATSIVGGELTIDGSGLAGPHALLDGDVHTDTVAAECSVGSLVIGTSGGWDELVIGANGAIMISNGTMAVWTGGVARGDLLVGDATPMWKQLTIGAAGTVLASNGTDVAWTAGITGTPGTLSVSTTNVGGADHTHAITSSADPGAAASILATNASGHLELVRYLTGGATEYMEGSSATGLNLVSAGAVGCVLFWTTGALYVAAPAAFYPNDSAYTLGSAAAYWGPVYTTGPVYLGSADNCLRLDTYAQLYGASYAGLAAGATTRAWLSATAFYGINAPDLGTTANKWAKGYFSDTVYAAKFEDVTSASYYLDPASTGTALSVAGNIVMSSGKTVDGVDVSEHVHTYDKADTPTGAGAAHHHHVSWACADTGAQIDDGGGNHHHVYQGIVNYVSGGVYTSDENEHTHGLTYTSTNSGKP